MENFAVGGAILSVLIALAGVTVAVLPLVWTRFCWLAEVEDSGSVTMCDNDPEAIGEGFLDVSASNKWWLFSAGVLIVILAAVQATLFKTSVVLSIAIGVVAVVVCILTLVYTEVCLVTKGAGKEPAEGGPPIPSKETTTCGNWDDLKVDDVNFEHKWWVFGTAVLVIILAVVRAALVAS